MNLKQFFLRFRSAVMAVPVVLGCLQAGAVSYDFSTVLTGGQPGGTGAFARLTITQDGPGKLDFRFEALDLAATEFLSYLKFNISGSAKNPEISVSDTVVLGTFKAPDFTFKKNPANDAGLDFDVILEFATAGNNDGAKRFTDGDIFDWSFSRTGLTVDDVDLPGLLHLQGIAVNPRGRNAGGSDSAKILASLAVQVPDGGATLALIGLGLLGLAAIRRPPAI